MSSHRSFSPQPSISRLRGFSFAEDGDQARLRKVVALSWQFSKLPFRVNEGF
jgi:hypothetical protein